MATRQDSGSQAALVAARAASAANVPTTASAAAPAAAPAAVRTSAPAAASASAPAPATTRATSHAVTPATAPAAAHVGSRSATPASASATAPATTRATSHSVAPATVPAAAHVGSRSATPASASASAPANTRATSHSIAPATAPAAAHVGSRSATPASASASAPSATPATAAAATNHVSAPPEREREPEREPLVVLGAPYDAADELWDDGGDMAVFTRVASTEIIYRNKRKRWKVVGRYIFGDLLGEGSYGKVKECMDKDTLERRAVKIFKRRKLRRKLNGEQNLQREIRLLKRLRHPNILRLFDVLHNDEKQKIYMILEFCVCQLKEMLDKAHEKRFPVWQAHMYFVQLMAGLEYLHSQAVVHNDIKPANLLLTADMTLKISDLGTAEELDRFRRSDEISVSQGSPAFQPPEIASGRDSFPGFKVDVWSSGVTLYNFVTGQYPFEGETVFKLFDNIARAEFDIPASVGPSLSSLLRAMMHKEPEKRLGIADIQQHDWVRKKQPPTSECVPVPPRHGSEHHELTVLPYIRDMHFGSEGDHSSSEEFITERQLNEREAARAGGAGDSAAANGPVRRRRNKPCLNPKSWSGCKQA